jgi:hypothetical protein
MALNISRLLSSALKPAKAYIISHTPLDKDHYQILDDGEYAQLKLERPKYIIGTVQEFERGAFSDAKGPLTLETLGLDRQASYDDVFNAFKKRYPDADDCDIESLIYFIGAQPFQSLSKCALQSPDRVLFSCKGSYDNKDHMVLFQEKNKQAFIHYYQRKFTINTLNSGCFVDKEEWLVEKSSLEGLTRRDTRRFTNVIDLAGDEEAVIVNEDISNREVTHNIGTFSSTYQVHNGKVLLLPQRTTTVLARDLYLGKKRISKKSFGRDPLKSIAADCKAATEEEKAIDARYIESLRALTRCEERIEHRNLKKRIADIIAVFPKLQANEQATADYHEKRAEILKYGADLALITEIITTVISFTNGKYDQQRYQQLDELLRSSGNVQLIEAMKAFLEELRLCLLRKMN